MGRVLSLIAWVAATLAAAQAPPHGIHFSPNGGTFVSAAGDTVHLEAVWREQRRFSLFVSDAFNTPFRAERLLAMRVSVDAGGAVVPMVVTEDATHLEARIGTLTLPAAIGLVITFGKDGPPERIALHLSSYSAAPIDQPLATPPTAIAGTWQGIVAAMRDDLRDAQALTDSSAFGGLYAPAIRLRDRLLALEGHAARLDSVKRVRAGEAIGEAVRAAWLLHTSADNGSPFQTRQAMTDCRTAFDEVFAAFGVAP